MRPSTDLPSRAENGAVRLVDELQQGGVDVVFGLPGVHNLPIWKAISGSGIRLVGVRHEQTAAYAADGYARATGRLGVAVVTTGPGAANAVAATGEAMASRSPILVIATEVATRIRKPGVNRGALHEMPEQAALFSPLTKSAVSVADTDDLAAVLREAMRIALEPPAGPVYVGVPTDLLAAAGPAAPAPSEDEPAGALPEAAIDEAVAILERAERPLLWCGGGAIQSGTGAVVGEIAEALAAPVLTTYTGRGILPPAHPCFVPGPVHSPVVGALWDEADVVLAIGTDFDGMMTQNWAMPAPPQLIAVNVDGVDAAKNYRPDLTVVGDARAVLERLAPRLPQRPGLDALQARLARIGDEVAAEVEADCPEAANFLDAFGKALPADAVVVADMCIPGYWLAGYWPAPLPRKLAYPVGWGTLGFGFPAAVGAALAGRGPAVCVTGDGGFLFACGELATLVQEKIPLTVVLVDDGGYGMLRFDQVHAGDEPFGVDLDRPDFAALARSFGISATTVEGFGGEFGAKLERDLRLDEPTVLVVEAGLTPPRTTSPRWYRRADRAPAPEKTQTRTDGGPHVIS